LLLDLLNKKIEAAWKQTLLYLAVFLVCLVVFWPAAWEKPLVYLEEAIRLFSDYAYWDFRVLYMGEYIRGAQAPWHYLPVWLGITIPLPFILLFLIGLTDWMVAFFRKGQSIISDHAGRLRLVFLGILFTPPLVAILLDSTLYNGWRHFQFIYPAFLMIALAGVRTLLAGVELKALKTPKAFLSLLFLVFCGAGVLFTTAWMIRHHPNQAVYFNRLGVLAGRENFERDYWRISARQGLHFLLAKDTSEDVAICIESQFEQREFLKILPEEMQARADIITNPAYFEICDYTVNTYRNPEAFMCEIPFFQIEVEGLPILTITQCRQP